MKRFLARPQHVLLSVLFLISSLALSFTPLLAGQAKAISPFDNSIKSAVYPEVIGNPFNSQTTAIDSPFNFGEMLVSAGTYSSCDTSKKDALIASIVNQTDPYILFTYSTGSNRHLMAAVFPPSTTEEIVQDWSEGDGYVNLHYLGIQQYDIWGINGGLMLGNCYSDDYITVGQPSGSRRIIEYSGFTFDYPAGYEGDQPEGIGAGTIPNFAYSVDTDKKLSAVYLRNLDAIVSGHRFNYELYASNTSYEEVTLLDERELDIQPVYEYTLPANDYYLLKITHRVPAPGLPLPDIKQLTIQIDFSTGQFIIGNTTGANCIDGLCTPPPITCNYDDIIQQMNCEMQKQLSIGVINPTINSFKNLLTSIIVPSDPTCSIPMTDMDIIPGKTMPLSQVSTQVCTSAQTVHTGFPFVSVLVNFLMALSIFYLVGRVINQLTNKNENDLVGGV